MKIAFPIHKNEGMNGVIANHFGRAPKFVIYNTKNKEFRLINNTGDHFGGENSTPILLKQNMIKILICKGLGRRAINRLQELGINIYITKQTKVEEALGAFFKGDLTLATIENACTEEHHNH